MRKIIWLLSLSVSCLLVQAQYQDWSTLPTFDCSMKHVMGMLNRNTILLSPDQSVGLEQYLSDYCSSFGEHCIRKKESECLPADYTHPVLAMGVIRQFRQWDWLKLPVQRIRNGFSVNGKLFLDSLDGIVWVDSNRILIAGNSLQAVKDVQLAFTGGHDLLLVQKGKITYFGNRRDGSFNWFNLQQLKQTNYQRMSSGVFDKIFVSKHFHDSINLPRIQQDLRQYIRQFLSVYQIPKPSTGVSWLLHANLTEFGFMSGLFHLTCPGNNSAGFSIRKEIHTNGYNIGLLKHEYSHFLFDYSISQDHNPAFFVEGSVEYVTNLNDTSLFHQRLELARRFSDSLNFQTLIVKGQDFYGRYSAENYAVCGVFVKYLMDQYGVSSFKQFCLAADKEKAAVSLFQQNMAALIGSYKSWLKNQ